MGEEPICQVFFSYTMIEFENKVNLGEWFCAGYKLGTIFIPVRKADGFKHTVVFSFFPYSHASRNTECFSFQSLAFLNINCNSGLFRGLFVVVFFFLNYSDCFYIRDFAKSSAQSIFVHCLFNLDHMFWTSFHASALGSPFSFLTTV